jgi:hypothetical protein
MMDCERERNASSGGLQARQRIADPIPRPDLIELQELGPNDRRKNFIIGDGPGLAEKISSPWMKAEIIEALQR